MNIMPVRRDDLLQPVLRSETLDKKALRLASELRGARAEEILEYAINQVFPERIALVSSFGAESVTLLHLVSQINPITPIVFLQTGKHFAQTLSYRRQLVKRLGLKNVQDHEPEESDVLKEDPKGDLWRENADACCDIRKVRPLKNALAGFDSWITGRKQFHGGARISLPVFEASGPHIKVNPLAGWSKEDVSAYVAKHDLPSHPLITEGFPSIGCWPCTHPAAPGDDVRSGRWRGADKTECGIHKL